ncbi:hypothetical protein PLICRDRAFT_57898 [Plicaturopsis crispa FD-325 SS-3]|uniref:Uncharacterized protein n=1 Tax=Plicaturopsis crispa FD-325 SS-3 TaxID=944288 RepID=A0A0C9SX14_PLICR|nr:hypothetical protein PLICRDRAFT_57898 [Plicaturopsis crispa FD-325 SS-3]
MSASSSSSSSSGASANNETYLLPLRRYLETACLQSFTDDQRAPAHYPSGRSSIWPNQTRLEQPQGTRPLVRVLRLDNAYLEASVTQYMREFDGIDVEYADMDVSALTLPTPDDLIDLEAEELEKFSSVNHSPAVKLLVKSFVLETIATALRIRYELPIDDRRFTFRTRFDLCPAMEATWDIVGLPRSVDEPHACAMVIICLHPGHLQWRDFDTLVHRQEFTDEHLNTFSRWNDHHHANMDKLWAVIHDACASSGAHFFAVTNYQKWAVGKLSPNRRVARVSHTIDAPIYDMGPGPSEQSVVATLTYWIALSLGLTGAGN